MTYTGPLTEAQKAVIDEQKSRRYNERHGQENADYATELWLDGSEDVARAIAPTGWTPPRNTPAPKVAKRSRSRRTDKQIVEQGSQVYGEANPSASWIQDIATVRTAGINTAIPNRETSGALDRLVTYERELKAEIVNHTPTGQRARRAVTEHYRNQGWQPHEVKAKVASEMADILAIESRASSTADLSLGAWCPPSYLLSAFGMYRTAAAPLVSQAGQAPLPGFGMKVEIPVLSAGTSPGVMKTSSDENQAITRGHPAASFVEASVGTYASILGVSQQLLDRTGPGITFDQVLAEQAGRGIGTLLDTEVAAAVISGAQTLTDSGSLSVANLWADAAQAANKTVTSAGTRLVSTHLFAPSTLMLYYMSLQSSGLPVWLPRSGEQAQGTGPREGYSGYDALGLDVFFENNLPAAGSASYVLVRAPLEALLVMQGELTVDVFPSWNAESLESVVRIREYAAFQVVYPGGFVAISGDTAYPADPWSA